MKIPSWALGAAAVMSLAAYSQPQPPKVYLLDEFPAAGDSVSITHGSMVESVLNERSPIPATRVQVSLGAGMDAVNKREPGGLNRVIAQRFQVPTEATARALDALKIEGHTVAGQSQGASDSRVLESVWGSAQSSPAQRTYLESELKLAPGASDREFLQALADRIHEVHSTDAGIAQARHHLLDAAAAAEDKGLIRVLSAGNQGAIDGLFQKLGVHVSEDFYRSDLADPGAIIVGASDHQVAAGLASPDAGAMIAIQGVDVPVHLQGKTMPASGSSFAEPQITAKVAQILLEHPYADRDRILRELQSEAHPVPGAEARVGAGVIPADWILTG